MTLSVTTNVTKLIAKHYAAKETPPPHPLPYTLHLVSTSTVQVIVTHYTIKEEDPPPPFTFLLCVYVVCKEYNITFNDLYIIFEVLYNIYFCWSCRLLTLASGTQWAPQKWLQLSSHIDLWSMTNFTSLFLSYVWYIPLWSWWLTQGLVLDTQCHQ